MEQYLLSKALTKLQRGQIDTDGSLCISSSIKPYNLLIDVVPNRKSEFNLLFDSYKDPFSDLFKLMPFWKLMKRVNKSIARGNKFINK